MKNALLNDEIPILNYIVSTIEDPEMDGIGLTFFTSGCYRKCIGCHNPESWEIENGTPWKLESIKSKIISNLDIISFVCFCGGEPLLFEKQVYEIMKFCKTKNLKTVLYTGYLWEEISSSIKSVVDIVIDGPFKIDLKTSKFPASNNQRVFIRNKELTSDEINNLKINCL